ncbi:hypothetical protein AVEN_216816-1 [Araneus ventricosus]|uniref:Uncharacterized protein n=1 Tax=Araneus ventricosus TaxID=182803 RepID=A0A4Y2MZJ7_ARAVE|nr:hypothetical protein AVEN_216816-1 [Araneus ventricosus]
MLERSDTAYFETTPLVSGSRPNSVYMALVRAKSATGVIRPPAGGAEVWREESSGIASSSSARYPKLRYPSQNSPRVASKRDTNVTKLN